MKRSTIFFLCIFFILSSTAQSTLVAKYTNAQSRAKLHKNLVERTINKNLSLPLNDSTLDAWEDGLFALELLNFRSAWVDGRVMEAVKYFPRAPKNFQRSLLELLYTNYPSEFMHDIARELLSITDPKLFAMSVVYLLRDRDHAVDSSALRNLAMAKFGGNLQSDPILKMLMNDLVSNKAVITAKMHEDLFSRDFLKGNILLYSIQRPDRDQPGRAIVRDASGNFVAGDSTGIFSVPHLARSLSSLPFYLTNGNTPQGIFHMYGFAVSASQSIGPSVNVQLCMPVECSIAKFFNDSTIKDTAWSEDWYKKLLPASLKNYLPIFGAYYAGAAGRSEIIAHGTTVDPRYYSGKPYYPFTPTMGCLSTTEIWDDDGRRILSDQQKLVDALLKAGGGKGYAVVIELPGNGPVSVDEVQKLLSNNSK